MLGRFEVRAAGELVDLGTPKQRAVLAVLLLEADRVVPAERLVALLWDDAPKAASSLQSYVSHLRRALEPQRRPRDAARVLLTEAPGYRLVVERSAVDVLHFEDTAGTGRELLRAGHPAEALAQLDAALASWGGPLLPELADEPFVVHAARRLEGLRLGVLGDAARCRLDLGDHLGAVALLEGPLAEHPLDERLHGLAALALYRSGRQADALRMVDRARRALADEAGLDLGPELRALEADLLAQSPTLDLPAAARGRKPAEQPTPGRAMPAAPARGGIALLGRDAEMRTLTERLHAVTEGRGGAAVLVGEPGMGKSRLLEEVIEVARSLGCVTAVTRCPESGAIPPFWPAVQLAEQARQAGIIGAALAPPEGGDEPAPPRTLFLLYEAVSSALRASERPLVLVIDDLQWCDIDTLRLLAHVAIDLADVPVLLVVAARPLDDGAPREAVEALDALARVPDAVHVRVEGLGTGDVATWLERLHGGPLPAEVAAWVHHRTGGQPLFVKELGELLAAEGTLADPEAVRATRAIPMGVTFVVRRRVARLPEETQHLLTVAAVLGQEFRLDLVAAVTETPLDVALDSLAPALDAGLVLDDGEHGFTFSHALVADALAAEVNAARRARLHASAARTLASRCGPRLGALADEIAHHAIAGAHAGTAELAAQASIEAARTATERLGYVEAAGHWRRAADALALSRPGDLAARVDALHHLTDMLFRSDLVREAKLAAVETIDLAEVAGDTDAMVRTAALVGNPHVWTNQSYGSVEPEVISALRRSFARIPADDLCAAALVQGALAFEMTFMDRELVDPVVERARDAARACGDPEVVARVMLSTLLAFHPDRLEDRISSSGLARDLALDHDLPDEVLVVAHLQHAVALWEAARFVEARDQVACARRVDERMGGSRVRAQLYWFHAATLAAVGEYDEALRLGAKATEIYRRTRGYDAPLIEAVLVLTVAADLGGLDEVLDQVDTARMSSPRYGQMSVEIFAWALLEEGSVERREQAAGLLAEVSWRPPDLDYTSLCGSCLALHNRVELGDLDTVARIMPILEPYDGRWSQAGSGAVSGGPVGLALARGAAALGDVGRARTAFAAATASTARLGAASWHVRALLHEARFLADLGEPAAAPARLAHELAEGRRFVYLARRAADLVARLP